MNPRRLGILFGRTSRSWFLVDLTVVVTDWVLLVSSGLDDMEILRVLRLGGSERPNLTNSEKTLIHVRPVGMF